jgi:hypothetical protein
MIDTTKTERLYPITGEMEVADPSKINHGAYYVRASDYDALDAQYKAIVESLRQRSTMASSQDSSKLSPQQIEVAARAAGGK